MGIYCVLLGDLLWVYVVCCEVTSCGYILCAVRRPLVGMYYVLLGDLLWVICCVLLGDLLWVYTVCC